MPNRVDPRPQWPSRWYVLGSLCLVALSLVPVLYLDREVRVLTSDLPEGGCQVWYLAFAPCSGIARLGLARDTVTASKIVSAILKSDQAWDAAIYGFQFDYVLIVFYVAFLGFSSATVANLKGPYDIPLVRRILLGVVVLQGVAGILDGVENVFLLAMLESGHTANRVPGWTFLISAVKWWLILIGIVAPVGALVAKKPLVRLAAARAAAQHSGI